MIATLDGVSGRPAAPPGRTFVSATSGSSRVRACAAFATASAAFFAVTAFLAHRKLLWFDELFTVFIAKQPDLARCLEAVRHGGDTLPPAIHLLTRASIAIFGEHHLALRLPSMVGYWLMLVCLYAFVRFRCSPIAAWSAALVPLATNTYWYAFEARPYGLLLGLSALALVFWQRAPGARRSLSLVMLGATMFAAFLTHWYAAVLAGILVAIELLRRAEQRDPRWGALAVLALATALAAPILYPFLATGLALRGLIAPPAPSTFAFHAYDLVIGGFAPFVFWLLAIAAAHNRGHVTHDRITTQSVSDSSRTDTIPISEIVVAGAFFLIPLISLAIAWAGGSQLLPRYAATAVIGAALLVGYAANAVAPAGRRARAWTAVMVCAVVVNIAVSKMRLPDRSAVAARTGDFAILAQMDDRSEIVVVPDPLAFMRLAYYSPALQPRLVHVVDRTNLGSVAVSRLARFAPLGCEELEPFLAHTPGFDVYDVGFESPFLAAISARGASISVTRPAAEQSQDNGVFRVRMDRAVGSGAAMR